jgi:REP element-mobilizing transposase RayT
MPSTYPSLHYHVVFGTKDRPPLIRQEILTRLHEYPGGTIEGLGGFPERVGGVADHVHLLFGLKATATLSDFMRELKKASSIWMQNTGGVGDFAWQESYAAFTISATARAAVAGYIANRAEHHRKRSFREELIAMLEKTEVEYDEPYLD